ncbi:MAG TPA: hypothetical protein VG051_04535 [Candidatus Acidoferrum sp.]|nr:hypothetical protein [Candidatus Acidoferrum sp.]
MTFDGSTWIAIMDNIGSQPGDPNVNPPVWRILAMKGADGAAGAQGPAGPQGLTGPAGPQGLIGPAGPQGLIGPAGPQGLTGPAGAQGLIGPAGAQGLIGPAGPQGLIGPAGPQGLTGPAGAQGLIGPAGPQGLTGATGAPGTPGTPGAAGPVGPQGPTGPTGQQGPAGPNGSNGTVSVYQTPTPTPQTFQVIQLTPVASLKSLPPGFWSVFAKAQVSGVVNAYCFLMPHSDAPGASPTDTSVALDETSVTIPSGSSGPAAALAVVLTGQLDTSGTNDGADLLCTGTGNTGVLVFSQAKIVAQQASQLNTVGSTF